MILTLTALEALLESVPRVSGDDPITFLCAAVKQVVFPA